MKKEYFRNTDDLQNSDGEFVEKGSLFEKVNSQMILVDDDRFVEFPYKKEDFEFAFVEDMEQEE